MENIIEKIHCIKTEDFISCEYWPEVSGDVERSKKTDWKKIPDLMDMANAKRSFPAPKVLPPVGKHPRILFTDDKISDIKKALSDPECAAAAERFWETVKEETDGILPEADKRGDGFYNFNGFMMESIRAKAFYYCLYKNDAEKAQEAKMRGYEAIFAIKNFLLTLCIHWRATDQCRLFGFTIYNTALVYDWCYDLLTEEDKEQLMLGVQNRCCIGHSHEPWTADHGGVKLEVGFPPQEKCQETPLTGHGAEYQVLRDLFAFSIAIYDETPSWYNYIAGMLYVDYVPSRNYFYSASYYPDGTACYNHYRFLADLWNAWLFDGMQREIPYKTSDMKTVIHGMMSIETFDGGGFGNGDGNGASIKAMGNCALLTSYLFKDSIARAQAKYCNNGFSSFPGTINNNCVIDAVHFLILSSGGVVTAPDRKAAKGGINYASSFAQQIVAKSTVDGEMVALLLQGGQKNAGGHTHQSAGNFQVYYKGDLTTDDGVYDRYGSAHHYFYHQATVAHNGLLVFNPAHLSPDEFAYSMNGENWYSGGMKGRPYFPPYSFEEWQNDKRNEQGYTRCAEYGFVNGQKDKPEYVYLRTDLAPAYPEDTVRAMERSHLAVFPDKGELPLLLFVYDDVTATDASFEKTFLLQCVKQPSLTKNSVCIDNEKGGRLVLTNVFGCSEPESFGGYGEDLSKRFWISGQNKNLMPQGGLSSRGKVNRESVWGHAELHASRQAERSIMLQAIYVTNAEHPADVCVTGCQGEGCVGAVADSVAVFFADGALARDAYCVKIPKTKEASVSVYFAGLSAGEWDVVTPQGETSVLTVESGKECVRFPGYTGTWQIKKRA